MDLKTIVKQPENKYTVISVFIVVAALAAAVSGFWFYPPAGYIIMFLSLLAIPFIVYFFGKALALIEKRNNKTESANRRLYYKAEYYESILQESTDMIFTIDNDGFILKFNKGAEAVFGYSQVEIVGKSFSLLLMNEADGKKIFDAVLRESKISNMEVAMKTAIGETVFVSFSVSEMRNNESETIGLVATCKNITEKKKLEQELVKKNKQLEELAITDSLTGLFNSRYFYDILQRELNRMKRQKNGVLSVLMIDIDSFKIYNDTCGHQAGDKVLRSLGQIIATTIRSDIDSGYRYGGDEFTVILPNTNRNHARLVTQRIKQFYNQYEFVPTGLSIGIADTEQANNKDDLVRLADKEMYQLKKHRR